MEKKQKHFLILGIIIFQLVLPLKYYMSQDIFDERFAWRMFSPVRMVSCSYEFFEGEKKVKVQLFKEIHIAFLSLIKRGRMAVVKEYLSFKCKELAQKSKKPILFGEILCLLPKTGLSDNGSALDYKKISLIPSNKNLCEKNE